MSFNGTEGSTVDLSTAQSWTTAYRTNNPGHTIAHFFGKDILNNILSQEGCMGIRIYYAENGTEKKLVICGADSEENDMLEIVGDYALPCPKRCSTANVLNS